MVPEEQEAIHARLVNMKDLGSHPKLGASWEGFVISQVIGFLGVRPRECFAGQHSFDMGQRMRAVVLPQMLDELKSW